MKAKHPIGFVALIIVAGSILLSCDRYRVFDTFSRLPHAEWHVDSLKLFEFEISDTKQIHNIYFNIRNDRSYGFSNLWLFVSIIPPTGEPVTDTIQVILADPRGKWLGKGFSGLYTSQVPYRTHVFFPEQGKYTIRIQHGMRPEIVKGITDIGIRIERSGK